MLSGNATNLTHKKDIEQPKHTTDNYFMLAVFLDIETTGLDPKCHHAIDIALICVDMSTHQICASYQSLIAIDQRCWDSADPNSLAINGYSWDEVQTGFPAATVAADIIALFATHDVVRGQAVFICQNPTFDRAFFTQLIDTYRQEALQWPYHWLDLASMFWALEVKRYQALQQAFPSTFALSKNTIAAHYGLAAEPAIHRAMNGVKHLLLTYGAVFGIHLNVN